MRLFDDRFTCKRCIGQTPIKGKFGLCYFEYQKLIFFIKINENVELSFNKQSKYKPFSLTAKQVAIEVNIISYF